MLTIMLCKISFKVRCSCRGHARHEIYAALPPDEQAGFQSVPSRLQEPLEGQQSHNGHLPTGPPYAAGRSHQSCLLPVCFRKRSVSSRPFALTFVSSPQDAPPSIFVMYQLASLSLPLSRNLTSGASSASCNFPVPVYKAGHFVMQVQMARPAIWPTWPQLSQRSMAWATPWQETSQATLR